MRRPSADAVAGARRWGALRGRPRDGRLERAGGGEASNAMLSRRTIVLNTTFLSLTMV